MPSLRLRKGKLAKKMFLQIQQINIAEKSVSLVTERHLIFTVTNGKLFLNSVRFTLTVEGDMTHQTSSIIIFEEERKLNLGFFFLRSLFFSRYMNISTDI